MRNYKYEMLNLNILERFVWFCLVPLNFLCWGYHLFRVGLVWFEYVQIGLDRIGYVWTIFAMFVFVCLELYKIYRFVWIWDMFEYV